MAILLMTSPAAKQLICELVSFTHDTVDGSELLPPVEGTVVWPHHLQGFYIHPRCFTRIFEPSLTVFVFSHPWFWRNLPQKKTSGFLLKNPIRFPRKIFLHVLAAARSSDHSSISACWLDFGGLIYDEIPTISRNSERFGGCFFFPPCHH